MRLTVNNSGERYAAKVTIADLAQNSFTGMKSDDLSIYQVDAILDRHWRDEIETSEEEYLSGVFVTFKDGSKLSIGAWADCCDGSGCKHCGCH
jgi:hypothetical protein